MTTDHRALADELERLFDEYLACGAALTKAVDGRKDAGDERVGVLLAEGKIAAGVMACRDTILAALRAASGADVAAAYRAGLEAGARECEAPRSLQGWIATSPAAIAAAIRALPVPPESESRIGSVAEVTEAVSRLLDALRFWRESGSDEIHMQHLATEDSEETIGDLIDAALAAARSQP